MGGEEKKYPIPVCVHFGTSDPETTAKEASRGHTKVEGTSRSRDVDKTTR